MGAATESQRALLARLIEVLGADDRIESAWLSGSFGKGGGDAWSDVDVTAVVDEEDLPHCIREYGGVKTPVGDTVLLHTVHGRVVSAVRADWERYDIVFVTPQEFRTYDRSGLRPLKLESLDAPAPPPRAEPRPYQPSIDGLERAINEFLRVMGLLPVAVGREEWLVGFEGIGLLRKALIEMMFEANGISRGQRGGAKAINAHLTPEQRAAVEEAPLGGPCRNAMIDANKALAGLFLPLARETLAKAGGTWPQTLEDATRAHLKRVLNMTF